MRLTLWIRYDETNLLPPIADRAELNCHCAENVQNLVLRATNRGKN